MKTFFSDNDFKDGIGWGIISVLVIGFATNNGILRTVADRIPTCCVMFFVLLVLWVFIRYTPLIWIRDFIEKGIGILSVFIFAGLCYQVYLHILSVIT